MSPDEAVRTATRTADGLLALGALVLKPLSSDGVEVLLKLADAARRDPAASPGERQRALRLAAALAAAREFLAAAEAYKATPCACAKCEAERAARAKGGGDAQ